MFSEQVSLQPDVVAGRNVRQRVKFESLAFGVGHDEPVEPTGSLSVNSKPTEATVFVDSLEMGNTNLIIKEIDVGEHTIWIDKSEYRRCVEKVTIREGDNTRINVRLKPDFARLEIGSVPPGASLTINGYPAGLTPYANNWQASGKLIIKLNMPLYQECSDTMTLTPEQYVKKNYTLSPVAGR
jgi:hypothetical protein